MTQLIIFGIALPWLLLGYAAWIGYLFLGQIGRILLRLDALEQQLKQIAPAAPSPPQAPAAGLAVGAEAPAFELPDLAGEPGALAAYRGRKVLLIFFNPQCGYCTGMLPDLAAWTADGGKDRPMPLVVTTGKVEDNRRLFDDQGIRCRVLLQEQMTVAARYQVHGTPMGYLIDEDGKIASPVAVGKDALLALSREAEPPRSHNGQPAKGKPNRGLETSRINRSGLKAGTPAPAFRLPRLDGGELALDEFRGRRVLLVFSDPHCGPCNLLAPRLERVHRDRSDVEVLMISRGEAEENRAKAAEFALTFPIALQRQWEISLLYGMFATPIGYLIDEQGALASDVATGVEPILALLEASAVGNDTVTNHEESRRPRWPSLKPEGSQAE